MSKINISELDFDLIKQDLLNYLQNQKEFSEYNFEGSGFNILLDILSINTHKNAFMANMLANEMFLDSATLRDSVISKSQEIGYIPRSVRSAKAVVNIEINSVPQPGPEKIKLESGTPFSTNTDYNFSTRDSYYLYSSESDPTKYIGNNIELYEGNTVHFHYTVDSNDEDQKFIIPSENVDITTLRVFVQPNKNSTEIVEYFLNDNVTNLDSTSTVFFVTEMPSGYYEVTFGDGVLGKALENENYITLQYIVSQAKKEGNYIDTFIPLVDIDGYISYTIETVEPSYGGDEKENIKSIKFNAPKMYHSQGRAVTLNDYETFILSEYSWIDTINSWGGETNNPPVYGKIFFSIKPKHTEFLSNKLKEEVKNNLIKKYNVVTVIPEIIDPEYIYINIDSTVFYKPSKTVHESTYIVSKITENIYKYFDDTTKKFKLDFSFSPLVSIIDNSDPSIVSSLTDITVQKRIYPQVNMEETFEIKFFNELLPGTFESSYFSITSKESDLTVNTVSIKDDRNGNLDLINITDNTTVKNKIGSINYDTGTVSFTIIPIHIPQTTLDIRLYATPKYKNIKAGYNQIIIPDTSTYNTEVNIKHGVYVTVKSDE